MKYPFIRLFLCSVLCLPTITYAQDQTPSQRIITSRDGPERAAPNLRVPGELSSDDLSKNPELVIEEKLEKSEFPGWPNHEATEALSNLSRALGEAHFLRIKCQGRKAQELRVTMQNMLDREAKYNQALRQNLVAAFNNGYTMRESLIATCDKPETQKMEIEKMQAAADAAKAVTGVARNHLKGVTKVASTARSYVVEEPINLRGALE